MHWKRSKEEKIFECGNWFFWKYAKILKLEIPEKDKESFGEYDTFIRNYAKIIFIFINLP